VAGKAKSRGRRGRVARRHERVETREQSVALRFARRIAESVRRDEGRHGERLCVAEREVGEARQTRLEAVHDVEAAECERQRQVRARADRDADPASTRDRNRRPEGDNVRVEPVEQCAPARGQIARAVGGREDRDGVSDSAELGRDPRDVLVDVVRLRPGERRDETDPKAAHATSVVRRARRPAGHSVHRASRA